MSKNYFTKKITKLNELTALFRLLLQITITVINPIAWLTFGLIKTFMGRPDIVCDNDYKLMVQMLCFGIAIISYIGFFVYLLVFYL